MRSSRQPPDFTLQNYTAPTLPAILKNEYSTPLRQLGLSPSLSKLPLRILLIFGYFPIFTTAVTLQRKSYQTIYTTYLFMKKYLLFAVATAAAMSMTAQTAPAGKWANLLDGTTTSGDQISGVACNNDGVYWLSTMGSTETDNNISYAGENLFAGENYNAGNSQTNNLCLLATDADGAKQWVIYSNSGDYANNSGSIALDEDGNVVFAIKARQGDSSTQEYKAMNFVDAEGTVVTFGTEADRRSYGMLVAKADKAGKILWHKYVSLATAPAQGNENVQDFVADAIKVAAVEVDSEGNIYVAGNYSADMTVAPGVVLPARNVENAKIDAQTSTGAMFILKYDADGNYLANVIGNDGLTQSQILDLQWANNSLYFYGNAKAKNEGDEASFGGKSLAASVSETPLFGQLNADLSALWLNKLNSEPVSGSCVMQNPGINVVGDIMWLAGQFNGKYINPANADEFVATANKTPREGCIIKLNATDGSWINGTTSRSSEFTPAAAKTGLTGYFKVLQNAENPINIYVYGYVMNATVGVVLREYNAETLEANLDHAWSLVTKGGAPSCTAIAHNPSTNMAYISARGNQAFDLIGGISTPAPAKWGNMLAGVEMPRELLTGVTSASVDASDGEATYYNLNGMKVSSEALTPGIYICRRGNSVTKVLIK